MSVRWDGRRHTRSLWFYVVGVVIEAIVIVFYLWAVVSWTLIQLAETAQ